MSEATMMVWSVVCVYGTSVRASAYLSYIVQKLVMESRSQLAHESTHFAPVASEFFAVSLGAGLGAAGERPVAWLGS